MNFFFKAFEVLIEKIQDSSMAFLNVVPNKFLFQAKQETNQGNPIKFKKKIQKYNKSVNSNTKASLQFKEIFTVDLEELYHSVKVRVGEFTKKMNKIMNEITNFIEKFSELQKFIDFLKVKIFIKKY